MKGALVGLRGARRPRVAAGALLCDVEPDEFRATCRIPLFPEQWNTWLVVRTLAHPGELDLSRGELEDMTRAVLRRWFAESASVPTHTAGMIDNAKITVGAPIPAGAPVEVPEELRARERLASLADCPMPTRLRSGPYVPIVVQFVSRGVERDMPWPARRVVTGPLGIGAFGSWCPVDADWLLESVWGPIPGEDVPDPPKTLPGLPDVPVPDFSGLADAAGGLARAVAWGVGGVLAVALLVVLLK